MKREAFLPLFVGDFFAATLHFTGLEQSLYALCLMHQWAVGSIPSDPVKLASVLRWDSELFRETWPVVAKKFTLRDGQLVNLRLEEHREKSKTFGDKRAEVARAAAAARWANRDASSNASSNASSMPEAMLGAMHEAQQNDAIHPIPSHPKTSEPPKPSDSPQGGSGGKRIGTRCPEPFVLTAAMRSWCATECPHVDPQKATAEFVDYWRAVPGPKGRKLDWLATWRNSMRSSEQRAARFNGSGKPKREAQSDYVERLNREADEAGEPKL